MARKKTWTLELARAVALTCTYTDEFKSKHKGAWCYAQRNGILDEVQEGLIRKSKTGKFISDESIKQVALTYDNRTAFKLGNRVMYEEAFKRNIMEKICSHMPYGAEGSKICVEGMNKPYTDEELLLKALKYTYRSEMCDKDGGAYRAILKRNLDFIEKAFAHMSTKMTQVEQLFIDDLVVQLKSIFPGIQIRREIWISDSDRIDLVITLNNNDYYIEAKSEKSKTFWTKKEIKDQMSRYSLALKDKKSQLYMVSENGKYGLSVLELFNLLSNREVILPIVRI